MHGMTVKIIEELMFVVKALSTGSLQKYQGSEQDVCVCSGEH